MSLKLIKLNISLIDKQMPLWYYVISAEWGAKRKEMYMKRIVKVLCVTLSMLLSVNLAGIEVLAEEISSGMNQSVSEGGVSDELGNTDDGTVSGEEGTPSSKPSEELVNNSDGQTEKSPDDEDISETDEVLPDTEKDMAENNEEDTGKQLMAQAVGGNLSASAVESNTKLEVSWNALPDAKSYSIAVKAGNAVVKKQENISEAKVVLNDLSYGIKYMITVTAVNDSGEKEVGTIPAILLSKPTVKATAGDGTVKLSWSSVTGANKYYVTYGSAKKETGTSYTYTKLKNGVTHQFKVQACAEYSYEGKNYSYTSEVMASARPVAKPSRVTGVSAMDGDKSAVLNWSKTSGATSYVVYRYNSSKKVWQTVKTKVTKTTYTDTKLKAGSKYKYRIAAVNSSGTGPQSSTVTVSVKKTPGTKVRTIGYKAVVKSRAPLFTSSKSKKRVKYLKTGTRVTTIDYARGRYQLKLSNGKTYWISKDRLRFTSSIWTTKDYSSKVKTDYINKKGYSSPTKYLIWINQYTQRVTIFEGKKGKWKINRSVKCATGTHLHMTPKGKFKITYKEKGWFYRSTYEKPIVHFQSQNSFHSRIKFYKGGYADATIGRPKSKGCVRLYDADINFIYKKCPKGTTVISH